MYFKAVRATERQHRLQDIGLVASIFMVVHTLKSKGYYSLQFACLDRLELLSSS